MVYNLVLIPVPLITYRLEHQMSPLILMKSYMICTHASHYSESHTTTQKDIMPSSYTF